MKKRKLQKKLTAAERETDLFAELILQIVEQSVRIELQSVQDLCERAQQERDLAIRDMRDAEVESISLENKLNEIRDAVWGDVDSTQALYMVRRLVPNTRSGE